MKNGDRVHYVTSQKRENGIIKSIQSDLFAFVVFNCAGEWEKYMKYTAALTPLSNIRKGWVDELGNILAEYCEHYYLPTNRKWQPINQMQCENCKHIID